MSHHNPSHNELVKADKDHQKAAAIAKLRYIDTAGEGIKRVSAGKSFTYFYKNKKINDHNILERIKKLAIPPSWKEVWICPSPAGHIQATGKDLKKRKQYRYHKEWEQVRSKTKFHRLIEFGKVLPKLRKKVRKDIGSKGLTEEKILATTIKIMEETHIRIGNNGYEKLYGSYGLTTLKDKHVTFKKDKTLFSFTGKKGIRHEITLSDRRLAHIIRQCRDIPGKELFQYYTKDNQRRTIDSGMVNNYIHEATGSDFSAKDFRTWAGSLLAIESLQKMKPPDTKAVIRKNIAAMLDDVGAKLGNTGNICKKYYIHPEIISFYEKHKFFTHLKKCNIKEISTLHLTAEEKRLMYFLSKCR